jgi:hypothetical protein
MTGFSNPEQAILEYYAKITLDPESINQLNPSDFITLLSFRVSHNEKMIKDYGITLVPDDIALLDFFICTKNQQPNIISNLANKVLLMGTRFIRENGDKNTLWLAIYNILLAIVSLREQISQAHIIQINQLLSLAESVGFFSNPPNPGVARIIRRAFGFKHYQIIIELFLPWIKRYQWNKELTDKTNTFISALQLAVFSCPDNLEHFLELCDIDDVKSLMFEKLTESQFQQIFGKDKYFNKELTFLTHLVANNITKGFEKLVLWYQKNNIDIITPFFFPIIYKENKFAIRQTLFEIYDAKKNALSLLARLPSKEACVQIVNHIPWQAFSTIEWRSISYIAYALGLFKGLYGRTRNAELQQKVSLEKTNSSLSYSAKALGECFSQFDSTYEYYVFGYLQGAYHSLSAVNESLLKKIAKLLLGFAKHKQLESDGATVLLTKFMELRESSSQMPIDEQAIRMEMLTIKEYREKRIANTSAPIKALQNQRIRAKANDLFSQLEILIKQESYSSDPNDNLWIMLFRKIYNPQNKCIKTEMLLISSALYFWKAKFASASDESPWYEKSKPEQLLQFKSYLKEINTKETESLIQIIDGNCVPEMIERPRLDSR